MEHAPLRPVPSRPPGQVDPAEAIRHVAAELSALDAPAVEALALVTLAGRSREEVAGQSGLSGEQLAEALARARKALRRRLHPLPGSGWCERAERLISDRIDDALEDPGPARLGVHLTNCTRCVEHERRLGQAHEALVTGFAESTAPQPEPEPEANQEVEPEPADPAAPVAPAALRIVDPAAVTLEADGATALPPAEEAPALPDPEEPAALPDPEEQPQLAEAEEPEGAAELEGVTTPEGLAEPDEPPPLAEPDDPQALPEVEEPAAIEGPEASPPLGEVVQLPARPTTVPAPVPRGGPAPLSPPDVPAAPSKLPRRDPSPTPARSRVAATYATRPLPDASSGPMAGDEAWMAIGPLLTLGLLTMVMLAFAVLAVGV